MCIDRLRKSFQALTWILLSSFVAPAFAQAVEQTESWQQDEQIDIDLRALLGPVWQPVEFTETDRFGLFPLYKQEPPGAQGDFRPPPPVPTPVTVPTMPSQPNPDPDSQPSQPQSPPPPNAQNNQPMQPPPAPPPPAPPPNPFPCPIVYYDPNCGAGP